MCVALLFTSQHVASCITAQDTQHKAGDKLLLLQARNIRDFVIVMTLIIFFLIDRKYKSKETWTVQATDSLLLQARWFFPVVILQGRWMHKMLLFILKTLH